MEMKLYKIVIVYEYRNHGLSSHEMYFRGYSHRQAFEIARRYVRYMKKKKKIKSINIYREKSTCHQVCEWEDWVW